MESLPNLIDLATKQPQSAVEAFATHHELNDGISGPVIKNTYRSLIPSSLPELGQQYAFEVDLDRCSACKACVSACHHMNGLSSDESWRRVQQWFGEHKTETWFQTVTSACHHCVNPECMHGCPVGAYEKNPITGIVKHLDDQCIGCEYCIWKCPYEVPQYHESHGIVRKCDMCSDRLENQIEPACVQACPHDAIEIGITSEDALINDLTHKRNQEKGLYPGAPPSSITQPSSQYKFNHSQYGMSWTSLNYNAETSKPHWPLIWMLVMTQWGIGMLCGEWMTALTNHAENVLTTGYLIGIGCLVTGLVSSVFHLGKPLKAWKFFLGLRTSWLSREILAFNIFAAMIFIDVVNLWWHWLPLSMINYFHGLLILSGCGAILTSIMIYHDTGRPHWLFSKTAPRFLGTFLVGMAFQSIISMAPLLHSIPGRSLLTSCLIVLIASGIKLSHMQLKKTPNPKMNNEHGIKLVLGTVIVGSVWSIPYLSTPFTSVLMITFAFLSCLGIEVAERFQFFTDSSAPVSKGMHPMIKK